MKYALITCLSLLLSCTQSIKKEMNKPNTQRTDIKKNEIEIDFSRGPAAIVYKTKKDYKNLVAIGLAANKEDIISYPHPKDVYKNGVLAHPSSLNSGYLLDNLGIGPHSAFVNIGLQEFGSYSESPELSILKKKIIDNNPFVEMYNCGNRNSYKDLSRDINRIIKNGMLNKCKCLINCS